MTPTDHLQGTGLKARLLRGGVGSIAVKTANVGLSLCTAIVLARVLGVDGFGVYTFVYALVTLLAIPAKFGLPNLVVRETAKAEAGQQWGLMRGVWRWTGTTAVVLSLLVALASGCVAWLFLSRFSSLQLITFSWGLLFIPLLALGALRGAALQGLRKVVQGQLPEQIIRPTLLIALVFVFAAFSPRQLGADQAMALHALAAAMAFAIGAWLLRRETPHQLVAKPVPRYEARQWSKAVLPFALIAGMTALNNQIDIIMLGLFKTAADVGVYRVAARGAMLVALGVTAVNTVTGPYFARFYSTSDMPRLKKLATTSARANFLLALPATIVFILFGTPIIGFVFGAEYVGAYWPLAILAIAQLIRTGTGQLGPLLNMTGHESVNMRIAVCSTICNILLNLALIPPWGIKGAALATGSAMIIRRVISWWFVRDRLGLDASVLGLPMASKA